MKYSDPIKIILKNKLINNKIYLPLSKSICNRVLMIHAYTNSNIKNLDISDADDSILLKQHLLSIINNERNNSLNTITKIDCKNAGTVIRFLLPYLSLLKKEYVLTGSERMQSRPIGALVDSLKNIGAEIKYLDKTGFPPIKVSPGKIEPKNIEIDTNQSSQFASALLMCLPIIQNESTVLINNKKSSWPYIEMTLKIMADFGIKYTIEENTISIKGSYKAATEDFFIESDWSSSSYWYQTLAIKGKGELFLKGLKKDSIQGDKKTAEIFHLLGIETSQKEDGILIKNTGIINDNIKVDFSNIPDLAPAVICTCAAMNINCIFTGLHSLNIKESRRIDVIQEGLKKLGYDLKMDDSDNYSLVKDTNSSLNIEKDFSSITINSYNDHRMVMAFAPFALIGKSINITQPFAVNKSYPEFWNEFSKIVELK